MDKHTLKSLNARLETLEIQALVQADLISLLIEELAIHKILPSSSLIQRLTQLQSAYTVQSCEQSDQLVNAYALSLEHLAELKEDVEIATCDDLHQKKTLLEQQIARLKQKL